MQQSRFYGSAVFCRLFVMGGCTVAGLAVADRANCAEVSAPWILTPDEYATARAEYVVANGLKSNIDPCEVAAALHVTATGKCSYEARLYGTQVLKEFQATKKAVQDTDFTTRDYTSAWASNYRSDLSEPGLSYAACAVAFNDGYTGGPQDTERLMPGHLVCTPSMVAYGKVAIARFDKAIKAELSAR